MEIITKLETALFHFKDGQLAAITHTNGTTEIYAIGEPMSRKELERFYEINKVV
jgi:hypothetical protein